MQPTSWFIKTIRSGKRYEDGTLPPEVWQEGLVCPTLNAFDNTGESRATVIIFYGNRVADIRVQGDVINTLQARMGTGGNNMPMVAQINDGEDMAIPIHDTATRSSGKRKIGEDKWVMDGKGNGLGIGKEGDPMNTLTSGDRHAVAYPIQGNMVGRSDTAGPQGKGYGVEGDPMFSLTSTDQHAVAYDEFNDSISEIHHTLRAGTKQSTGVITTAVRRLTPRECERLQGFPDDWTADQSDTHRYKQMGNAVTVNVAQWVFSRLADRL